MMKQYRKFHHIHAACYSCTDTKLIVFNTLENLSSYLNQPAQPSATLLSALHVGLVSQMLFTRSLFLTMSKCMSIILDFCIKKTKHSLTCSG